MISCMSRTRRVLLSQVGAGLGESFMISGWSRTRRVLLSQVGAGLGESFMISGFRLDFLTSLSWE